MARTIPKFEEWLDSEPIQNKYSLCALLGLLCWLFYCLGCQLGRLLRTVQSVVSRRRILPGPVPYAIQCLDIPSYSRGSIVVAVVVANIIAVSFRAQTWADVQKRSGCLAVTHLLPLCTGFSFSLPADVCRVNRDTFEWAHRWLGRVCVLHTVLHVCFSGIVARGFRPDAPFVIPFLAASSLVLILPCTLHVFLRRRPQAVIKGHYALALIGIGTLAYHLIDRASAYRWVLLGGVCAGVGWDIGIVLRAMWSHGSWRFTPQRAIARSFNRILWVDIAVPARWEAQPGQYVQLWMPGLGVRSWLQLPAFYVASVEAAREATRTLRLVTRPRPGIMGRITQAADASPQSKMHLPVFVLGPFGHPPDFGQDGTVLFVLEDIGLFRALPFIRHLVQESRCRRNTVRRLEVLWQVTLKNFKHLSWVRDEIQQILELDLMYDRNERADHRSRDELRGFDILHFTIHVLETGPIEQQRFRNRTRLRYRFYPINVNEDLSCLMDIGGERAAVAVCASMPMRAAVRDVVRARRDRDTQLIYLDLEPSLTWLADRSDGASYDHAASHASKSIRPSAQPTISRPMKVMGQDRVGRSLPARNEDAEANVRLPGETLVHGEMVWQGGGAALEGRTTNHHRWIRQKIDEGRA